MLSTIISLLALLVAIVGIPVGLAYFRGRVDNDLKWVKEELKSYREAKITDRLTRMETKQDVLWEVFAEQVLTLRPHLATRQSPFKLTEQAQTALSQVKACLNGNNAERISDEVLINIPLQLGMSKLKKIAEDNKMTLGELLSVISLELQSCNDESKTSSAE